MRLPAVLLGVALLATAACTNEIDQSTRPSSITGVYAMKTFGGRVLPALIGQDTSGRFDLMGGQLEMKGDFTWQEIQNYRFTKGASVIFFADTGAGSWTVNRGAAFVTFNDRLHQHSFAGTGGGQTMTLYTLEGRNIVYGR